MLTLQEYEARLEENKAMRNALIVDDDRLHVDFERSCRNAANVFWFSLQRNFRDMSRTTHRHSCSILTRPNVRFDFEEHAFGLWEYDRDYDQSRMLCEFQKIPPQFAKLNEEQLKHLGWRIAKIVYRGIEIQSERLKAIARNKKIEEARKLLAELEQEK